MILDFSVNWLLWVTDFIKISLMLCQIALLPLRMNGKRCLSTLFFGTVISLTLYQIPAGRSNIALAFTPVAFFLLLFLGLQISWKTLMMFIATDLFISALDSFLGSVLIFFPISNYHMQQLLVIGFSLAITWLLCRICQKHAISIDMESPLFPLFIVIQTITIFLSGLLMASSDTILVENKNPVFDKFLVFLTHTLALIIIIMGFLIYFLANAYLQLQEKHHLQRELDDSRKSYLFSLKKREDEMRRFRHDINGHLTCLEYYLNEGNVTSARSYIEELHHAITRSVPKYATGHPIIEALLNDRHPLMEENDIHLSVDGSIPSDIHISDFDLCTVFSNMLNNAIEACTQVNGPSSIQIHLGTFHDWLSIQMQNTTPAPANAKHHKEHTLHYGFGLKNIRQCARRYGGNVTISQQEALFSIDVIMRYKK